MAAGAACGGTNDPVEDPRPNIVLIMADDMGFSDIGCYGGEVDTPHLDALADNGLRFRQFYNGARCCPTRASLISGLYAHQAGVGHMTGQYRKDGEIIPSYAGDLSKNSVTIAEALKPAGYTTIMSGKWHVTPSIDKEGDVPKQHNWPRQRGFEKFWGTILGAGSFYDPVTLASDNQHVEPDGENFYYTTAIGDHAIDFIDESPGDKPFFLYMPFTSPHWPLHAPEEEVAKYKGRYDVGWDKIRETRRARMIEMGIIKEEWALTERESVVPAWDDAPNKEWEARRMEVYAAQISVMDETIGRFVDHLRDRGQLDNTLIFFLADNGGCAEELSNSWNDALFFPKKTLDGTRDVLHDNDPAIMPGPEETYQSYGFPWANVSNTPFRLYKHFVHEGGISSPLIVHWPEKLKNPGTWTDQHGHLIDIMASSLDAASAGYPTTYDGNAITPLEGKSLLPTITDGAAVERDGIFWEHEGNRAVLAGKWKLVSKWSKPEDNRWELYDLDVDRTETRDLAEEHPDQVAELSAKWQAWADKVGVIEWRSWDRPS
jgi:arylsulfatase A-like enzyme